jgi:hypothetical protein
MPNYNACAGQVELTVGFAAMPDAANLNYVVDGADEEEPVIAYP